MSMNITSFKLKKMSDLIIPLKAFKSAQAPDWNAKDPVLLDPILGKVRIEMGCGQFIEGIIATGSDRIAVTNLDLSGEASGHLIEELMIPAFRQSKGYLEAILVWEGGEVERLVVLDGNVSQAEVEL